MTALRRVDADFLALPRHLLADAAVSAALAAGASYADLRIHRITTEHIQLRDGLRQERASITDFHGLINQRVHIVLEQRAASAKAEQYWSGVKIVAGIASIDRLG